jgi:hypothetical protein
MINDPYLRRSIMLALRIAAEEAARPKPIVVVVNDEPPCPPEHSAEACAPRVTLH